MRSLLCKWFDLITIENHLIRLQSERSKLIEAMNNIAELKIEIQHLKAELSLNNE